MSKEKQTPCEAAWNFQSCIEPYTPIPVHPYFAAGFRAGEEGKKELLEALKALYSATAPHFDGEPGTIRVRGLAQAAIAKHTAK